MDRIYGEKRIKPVSFNVIKESVNTAYKSSCPYKCCIGKERQYYDNDTPQIEKMYIILKQHGVEEGLIQIFELMPNYIYLYRDVLRYYKIQQSFTPVPKDHKMIRDVYNIIWSMKTDHYDATSWVQRGVQQIHKTLPDHCQYIMYAILQIRTKLGPNSCLLGRLYTRNRLAFYEWMYEKMENLGHIPRTRWSGRDHKIPPDAGGLFPI